MRKLGLLVALLLAFIGCGGDADVCTRVIATDKQLAVGTGVSWPIPAGAVAFQVEGAPSDAAITADLLRYDASVIDSYPVDSLPSGTLPIVAETFAVRIMNTSAAPLLSHRVTFELACGAAQ